MKIIDRPSPNFDARTRPIDLVVLHYTGMQNAEIALARLTDPAPVAGKYPGPWQADDIAPDAPLGKVSAHYVVAEDGTVYRLVAEEHRAWHAGASSWDSEGDVNHRAIGIEIVNGGHDFGLPDFPDVQIEAVIALLRGIMDRWALKPARVVGHSDVAPDRKLDPGEKFPWKTLADAGVSIWPEPYRGELPASDDVLAHAQQQLVAFGYDVQATGVMDHVTKAALMAFQRRFRPHQIDGALDDETRKLLYGAT